jgi:hypothetical protein
MVPTNVVMILVLSSAGNPLARDVLWRSMRRAVEKAMAQDENPLTGGV